MYILIDGDAAHIPLPDDSVDLVMGSPPYMDARQYLEHGKDLSISRDCRDWVEWMLTISREAVRVSRGVVIWVVAGTTRKRNYQPGPEGLIWRWYESGGFQECPCYWHRSGIPGSGGDQWFRKDVEYVIGFKKQKKLPWSNNTAMGSLPKYGPGGARTDKSRPQIDKNGITIQVRRKCLIPEKANPGNLIKGIRVGGGNMGNPLAHKNEAPYPERLAEWFIRSLCPPGGIVLDPFSGSGTTVVAANRLKRIGIGIDIRPSQSILAKRRIERPHAPFTCNEEDLPLFRQQSRDEAGC